MLFPGDAIYFHVMKNFCFTFSQGKSLLKGQGALLQGHWQPYFEHNPCVEMSRHTLFPLVAEGF